MQVSDIQPHGRTEAAGCLVPGGTPDAFTVVLHGGQAAGMPLGDLWLGHGTGTSLSWVELTCNVSRTLLPRASHALIAHSEKAILVLPVSHAAPEAAAADRATWTYLLPSGTGVQKMVQLTPALISYHPNDICLQTLKVVLSMIDRSHSTSARKARSKNCVLVPLLVQPWAAGKTFSH